MSKLKSYLARRYCEVAWELPPDAAGVELTAPAKSRMVAGCGTAAAVVLDGSAAPRCRGRRSSCCL